MSRQKRWLPGILRQIHDSARNRRVRWTNKALEELDSLELGLQESDGHDVLMNLTMEDFAGREISKISEEWMYIFIPRIEVQRVYLQLLFRDVCVIVSFHEDRKE